MGRDETKKVGILTFHYSNNNFGAVLQAYALYNLMIEIGHRPYIIDFKPPQIGIKAICLDKIKQISGCRFSFFRKKNFHNKFKIGNSDIDLKNLNSKLDVFTVGSDQVWRYRDDLETLKHYYLDFVDDDKPKIAIAASFGLSEWTGNDSVTQQIKTLVKRFSGISVREHSGVSICKQTFDVQSTNILDPTLLVNPQLIHSLCSKSNNKPQKKYLAYMLLDDSTSSRQFFNKFSKSHDLKFKTIKGIHLSKKPDIWWFNSIGTWLNYLKKSELIVTDSFHCVVFSLIFRKKFICLTNSNRGISRLQNLLHLVGLEDRLVNSFNDETVNKLFSTDIEYDKVWKILNEEKQSSIEFIKSKI